MTTNTVFQLRRNSVSGTRPTTTTVAPGELAINTTDGILFSANSTAIFEIGANNTTMAVGNSTVRQTANSTGLYVNGSLAVTGNASVTGNLVIAATGELIFSNGAGIQANGGFGVAGQVLTSNGTGVYWQSASAGLSEVVSQQFTANGTANSFTVAGGYFPNGIEVYLAGVKQVPGTDVTITSGSTVDFTVAPLNGQVVDVFGYKAANNLQSISAVVSQQFTANGTTNTFTISTGYIPNAIEVYVSGVKRIPVTDVDITSGSTITFTTAPLNGQVVDVFGYRSTGIVSPFLELSGGTLTGNLRFNNAAVIVANGSFGTNGQVLTSNGTSMYWSSAGFTNGQSISVNNFVITGAFTANSSNGGAGQVLTSNGTGVYWSSAGVNTAAQYAWTNTHTFSANINFDSGTLFVDSTNDRVGLGTNSPVSLLTLRGYTGGTSGSLVNNHVKTMVIGGAFNQTFNTNNSVLLHIADYSNDPGDNVYPLYIEDENNVVDFYLWAGNTGTGTDKIAYFGGNVGIGNTTPNAKLQVTGTANISGNVAISGITTLNANVILGTSGLSANGGFGTAGQVLTSNGTGVYWATAAAGVNTADQYTWSNTHNFTNVVTFSTANAIILPRGNTASRPAASNGMIRYNTNTQTIEAVANNTWTNMLAAYSSVREQFTATNNQTTFTVTGGYVAGQIDVYYNGVKLRSGSEVNVSSGNTVVLAVGAANGALIEVVGIGPTFVVSNTAQIVYQQFTATNNQTTFTVSNGYVPGQVDVFADGIKLVNGVDVNVSSGGNIVLSTGVPNNTIVEVKGYTTPITSAQSSTAVRQTFTANSTVNNNFTVTGGYIPGQVDVFYNGAKLVNGSDVNTSSGTTIVLTSNAVSGAIVDVVGINYFTAGGGVTTPVRQQLVATANQTTFTVTGGYTPGQIDVFRNGVKLTPGADVNISSGSNVVLVSPAANGDNIDVVGFAATSYQDSVRKSGDTISGSLGISANLAVTGTSSLTGNVTTSGVFTDPTGTIRPIVQGTVQTATGTFVDFTGIPSWARRITVMFNGVSTNGSSLLMVQVGAGSISNTGYLSSGSAIGATTAATTTSTIGFIFGNFNTAAGVSIGSVAITNISGNNWIASGGVYLTTVPQTNFCFGSSPTLAGALDRIRVTTVNGTDAFDAGTINILYE